MAIPFIKLCRSKLMEDVLDYPPAFIVLTHIALRARRDDISYNPHGLKINQAFIGDVAKMKVTPREYRTAIKRLTKWRIIDKQATNKGTIVTLLLSDIYDINSDAGDKQVDKQATNKETSKRQLIEEGKKQEGKKSPSDLGALLSERFAQQVAQLDEPHQARWAKFVAWEKENPLPAVFAMPKPLLPEQFFKLLNDFPERGAVVNVLLEMENWTKLATKKSAYLTAHSWLTRAVAK